MSDRITLTGIKGFGYHGILEFEAVDGQDFIVDLVIVLDLAQASVTDDLDDTIDYGPLAAMVVEEIEGERVKLIEKLAGRIADRIALEHQNISQVIVTVHKSQAPVEVELVDVSVTIERNR